MLRYLALTHDGVTRITLWVSAAAVAYLTLATAVEVFLRYALNAPSDWSPDTCALAFALIVFLAAPSLVATKGHAAMTFLAERAAPPLRLALTAFTQALGSVACAICAWFGAVELVRQIEGDVMMISVTPIPKWLVTGVIVYGLASMALHFLRQLVATVGGGRTGQGWDAS